MPTYELFGHNAVFDIFKKFSIFSGHRLPPLAVHHCQRRSDRLLHRADPADADDQRRGRLHTDRRQGPEGAGGGPKNLFGSEKCENQVSKARKISQKLLQFSKRKGKIFVFRSQNMARKS